MRYVVKVTTFIRSSDDEEHQYLRTYKSKHYAGTFKRAKQLEKDLTFSHEGALDRVAWQEAYVCVPVRIGRQSEEVLVPLSECMDVAHLLEDAYEKAMNDKLGPKKAI